MGELAERQKKLWELLCASTGCKPMLRVSRTDDCYWICDAPRHLSDIGSLLSVLTEAGFVVVQDEAKKLCKIDLPMNDPLYGTAEQPVGFPSDEKLLIYALYRLLSSHPAPPPHRPQPLLRRIVKATELSADEQNKALRRILTECAALVNRKQPLPSAATGLLASIIRKEEEI